MPTSDATPRKPLWRKLLGVVSILVVLIALDVALTLALEPYGTCTDAIMHEYWEDTANGEQFDTLVIGTSVGQYSLNPHCMDNGLLDNAFCISTPIQSFKSSRMVLDTVLKDHPIRRVIVGTTFFSFASDVWPNSNMALTQSLCLGLPFPENAYRYAQLALDNNFVYGVKSLAFFVPFTLNHVDYSPSAVRSNIQRRIECATPMEAEELYDPTSIQLGNGFTSYAGAVNFETINENNLIFERLKYQDSNENNGEMEEFASLCALCQEKGIELIVFMSPKPVVETIGMGDLYPKTMKPIQDIVTSCGGTYLDFNLIKPDVYEPLPEEFWDEGHLNDVGAKRFSPVFAEVVSRIENNEDLSGLFYSYDQWNDYLSSIDTIAYVHFTPKPIEGGFLCEGEAFTGSNCQVEYAYERQEDDGSWTRVKDWSTDPNCTLLDNGYRTVNVRIMARQVGATDPELYRYQTVTFLGN